MVPRISHHNKFKENATVKKERERAMDNVTAPFLPPLRKKKIFSLAGHFDLVEILSRKDVSCVFISIRSIDCSIHWKERKREREREILSCRRCQRQETIERLRCLEVLCAIIALEGIVKVQ